MDEEIKTPLTTAGAGGGCFRKGAQIQLQHGKTIAIEELKEGAEILAFDESGELHAAKVTKVHVHEDPQPILCVKFWRGETYITPNHWVLNQYGNFAEMGSLTEHDALIDGMGHLRPIISAKLIGHEPVYNLTVEPHHTFIADGVRVHNGGHRERFPVVAGAGGGGDGGKGGGGSYRAAVEDPDSLQSRAMIGIIDLLGEGQIGGLVNGAQSIYFNDTPFQNSDGSMNFAGASWSFRDGQQTQDPLPGFSDVETPNQVSVRVKKTQPNLFTISNPNADAVRIMMLVPSLYSQDTSTGDVHGASVSYKFQISTNGGPFVDQNIGAESIDLDSGAVIGFSRASYSANITVNWSWSLGVVNPDVGFFNGFASTIPNVTIGDISNPTFSYRIEGSPNGGEWRTLASGTLDRSSATASTYTGFRGLVENISAALMAKKTHTIDTSGALSWRFRVVKISGMGDATLSGNATVTTPTVTMSGKTRSRYERSYQFNLPKPADTWTIKTIRLTDDAPNGSVSNDLYVDSIVEIVSTKLSYPNSAIVGISLDSSQFNSIPSRSYLVDGLYIKVPSNYNPSTKTYSGIWNGTFKMAISSNPAWILYDIITAKRYGLGNWLNVATIDTAKLYQIGQYCDQLVPNGFGGYEPRFSINTAIQTQSEAFKLVTDLCSAFNGMSYWAGGMLSFTQDSPEDSGYVFHQGNVIDGIFTYQSSSRKDRHSVVLVRWNDPDQNYKQAVEYVEDAELVAKYGIRKFETVAFGCNSRGQANRVGRWILYTEQYQSNMIQFRVGIDAALVMPGEIIKIHDTTRAGKRMGGRLKSSTLKSAELDSPITLANGSATISIRMPDGTFVDRLLGEKNGTFSTVTWANPLPDTPVPYAVWIVADSAVEPVYARVISVGQGESPSDFAITALEHNASKYDAIEKGMKLVVPNTSIVDATKTSPVTDIAVTEDPYVVAPGVLGISLEVSWSGKTSSYEVVWKRDGKYATNWATVTTTNPTIVLENVRSGNYTFKITSINAFGIKSAQETLTYTPVGKASAPGDVANFTIVKRQNDLLLTWNPVTDINLLGYEIRTGVSWESSDVITANFAGTMITHDQSAAGTYYYHIRSVNMDGVYSDNVSTCVLTLSAPATPQRFDVVQSGSRLELNWLPNSETDLAYYEIREGNAWNSATLVSQVKATTFTMPAGSIGTRQFWIKSVVSPGIYCDSAAWITTDVAMPTNSNVIVSYDEGTLGWPGNKLNMHTVGADLMMDKSVSRSEYIFPVDLLDSYRAQNSIYASFESIVQDTDSIQWLTSSFDWADQNALRHWAPGGIVDSVTAKYQISRKTGLMPTEIDGFPLDGNANSIKGKTATTFANASYEAGRFQTGLRVKGGTKVGWETISIPRVFRHSFWMTSKNVFDSSEFTIIELANATGFLHLSYDEIADCFRLVDHNGNVLTATLSITQGEAVGIAIVQTETTRKLFVAKVGEDPVGDENAFVPIGDLTKLKLYWT